jgi:hypothetical protein
VDASRTEQRDAVAHLFGETVDEALEGGPAIRLKFADLLAGAFDLGAEFFARETPNARWFASYHAPSIDGHLELLKGSTEGPRESSFPEERQRPIAGRADQRDRKEEGHWGSLGGHGHCSKATS